jgi:hypothetical protein
MPAALRAVRPVLLPAVLRRTLTADAATYRLVAGPGWLVSRERPDDGARPLPTDPVLGGAALVLLVLGGLHRLLWWRRRGLVLLVAGHRRWTWLTPDAATARAAATDLAHLVETGTWRPGTGPPPPLPGARPG